MKDKVILYVLTAVLVIMLAFIGYEVFIGNKVEEEKPLLSEVFGNSPQANPDNLFNEQSLQKRLDSCIIAHIGAYEYKLPSDEIMMDSNGNTITICYGLYLPEIVNLKAYDEDRKLAVAETDWLSNPQAVPEFVTYTCKSGEVTNILNSFVAVKRQIEIDAQIVYLYKWVYNKG